MSIKKLRFIEFLIIGVMMGMIEDIIAIVVTTGATIDFSVLSIVFLIAMPFAFISEYVVDHPRFWQVVLFKKDE